MLRTLAQQMLADGLCGKSDTVVVGISGGPDSMALLHLLLDLNKSLGWDLKLHLAHLNHQLRADEAEKDAAFVQALGDNLSLPCTIEVRDIARLAGQAEGGVEEVGRRERYAFFERVCKQIRAQVVALGHHADDNAETVLHRILRGTGLRGLAGIRRSRKLHPESDVRIIRPLLRWTRRELVEYLGKAGIAYREDETNLTNEPMRNRLRNVVLPLIEAEVNAQVREALLRLAEQATWHDEFLQEVARGVFERLVLSRTESALVLEASALKCESRVVQAEVVRLAYLTFGLGEQDLAFTHLASALDLLADPASGRQAQLPGQVTLEKRYEQLIFSLPDDSPQAAVAPEIAVRVPGCTLLPVRRLELECRIEPVEVARKHQAEGLSLGWEEYVDFAALHLPLVVRPRRLGERFSPLGAPGSKKISDFLTDAKVEPRERERVAVLSDQLGPVWIIGHRIDERVKLTSKTRETLHLHARPLDD